MTSAQISDLNAAHDAALAHLAVTAQTLAPYIEQSNVPESFKVMLREAIAREQTAFGRIRAAVKAQLFGVSECEREADEHPEDAPEAPPHEERA